MKKLYYDGDYATSKAVIFTIRAHPSRGDRLVRPQGRWAARAHPGEYGSPEFISAYQAAVAGEAPSQAPQATLGTLAWLIARYQDSRQWAGLATATQSQRGNIYKHICKAAGARPYSKITRKTISDAVDRRRETPFAANDFLKAMCALFKWAVKSDFVSADANPAKGVEGFGHKTEGFHVWTDEEVARFEARWPIGTRERLALAIMLYTGLRRGDVVRVGRQHIRNGRIELRTEKTGTVIKNRILPPLAEAIAATKTGDLAIIARANGAPMTKEGFGNWFRRACKAAGVPGRAHGLRKVAATRAAHNHATVPELDAIFGWKGGRMAALYTAQADRERLADGAIETLAREDELATSNAAPPYKVRRQNEKS